MMENLNAQVCSLYGEYRDVSSMMVLMTAHQPQGDGDNMMTKRVPLENSNSSFHDLISGAAIFYSNNLQRQYRLEMAARPVSSAPLVKMGGCHNFTNGLEFHSEEAVNCYGELSSMQSGSQLITSLAPHADSPNFSSNSRITTDEEEMDVMKAKILGHPQYRCLLEAYVHCIKVGVPPEIVARLDAAAERYENGHNEMIVSIGMDPELDMFMETYCEMLSTFKEKLAKPVKEAMSFFKKIETQLNSLNNGTIDITPSAESDEKTEGGGSVDEEDCSTGETDYQWAGLHSEEQELKDLLRRKYSGYLGSLKQEFMKKKKRGKLPKEARQKLLDWWNLHQKWPYPSETEKMALAEWTRLDQKQINNWFINQRKRHWKPDPEDTEFVLVDSHGTHTADFFVERHLMAEGSSFHLD